VRRHYEFRVRARPVLSADGRVRVSLSLSSVQVVVGCEPEEKLYFTGVRPATVPLPG
jgi:hypothetical protein